MQPQGAGIFRKYLTGIIGQTIGMTKAKASLVIPVHNEQKYLPYLLETLRHCRVYEAIFVLDRCTDQSKTLIDNTALPFEKRIIELDHKEWRSFTAEPVAVGFKNAHGDIIFCVGADFYLDPTVFDNDFEGLDFFSFRLSDYGLHLDFSERMLLHCTGAVGAIYERLRCFSLRKSFATGFYGIRREVYAVYPHRDVSDEDYLILMPLMRLGFSYKFFRGDSLHLKPRNTNSIKKGAKRAVATYHVGIPKMIWFMYRNPSKVFLREFLQTREMQRRLKK